MSDAPAAVRWRIDAADRIDWVDAAWLAFAAANDAPELTPAAVLGRNVLDFVTGDELRVLYAALHRSLRERPREAVVPFRCDSPAVVRHMELTLRPDAAGAIAMEGRVVATHERPPVALLERWAPRARATVTVCGVCRRFRGNGTWVDAPALLVEQPVLTHAAPPRLLESVCSECRARLDAA